MDLGIRATCIENKRALKLKMYFVFLGLGFMMVHVLLHLHGYVKKI